MEQCGGSVGGDGDGEMCGLWKGALHGDKKGTRATDWITSKTAHGCWCYHYHYYLLLAVVVVILIIVILCSTY